MGVENREPQRIDIARMSETELKALGYDLSVQAAQLQANLRAVQVELGKRSQQDPEKEDDNA